jgi:hypothetical protein
MAINNLKIEQNLDLVLNPRLGYEHRLGINQDHAIRISLGPVLLNFYCRTCCKLRLFTSALVYYLQAMLEITRVAHCWTIR